MNINALVENFYRKDDDNDDLVNEVLALFLDKPGSTILLEQRGYALTWDGIPDIPISEIPWSDVQTVKGGADIQGPQRQQLLQFLDDIEGDDLKDKIEGLAKFYAMDAQAMLAQTKDMTAKERISAAIGYLTFFKTLTKIIAHFNASSAGFSFEAFLGVLLGGVQIVTGEGTIADLTAKVGGVKVPISLKLYTEGSLKVGGSYTDLVNDLRKYEIMQYVAVTKDLDDEKKAGTLNFYRFNFTLDNIANILLDSGEKSRELIRLPRGFVSNPAAFENIEIPPPPKVEEIEKLYHDRVAELGAKSGISMDILEKAIKLVGLPDDTSQLQGQKRFGRDPLMLRALDKPTGSKQIELAVRMGLLPEVPPPYPTKGGKAAQPQRDEWMETYGERIIMALRIYNEVAAAAYNDVVDLTSININARKALVAKAGSDYLFPDESVAAYNGTKGNPMSPQLKKKALLLSWGYVNTKKFDISEPRVLKIDTLAKLGDIFPSNQTEVKLGSIKVGQEEVLEMGIVDEII